MTRTDRAFGFIHPRPAPEVAKWRVSNPTQVPSATLQMEFSLRANGRLLRRIHDDCWRPYEQFEATGWTIANTERFLQTAYATITRI